MKKRICILLSALALTVSMVTPAFAGDWKRDNVGWWYQNDNGSYPRSTWKWIEVDDDRDDDDDMDTYKCYYFDSKGYLVVNGKTPDGYTVGKDGAWIVNGVVQTKQVRDN